MLRLLRCGQMPVPRQYSSSLGICEAVGSPERPSPRQLRAAASQPARDRQTSTPPAPEIERGRPALPPPPPHPTPDFAGAAAGHLPAALTEVQRRPHRQRRPRHQRHHQRAGERRGGGAGVAQRGVGGVQGGLRQPTPLRRNGRSAAFVLSVERGNFVSEAGRPLSSPPPGNPTACAPPPTRDRGAAAAPNGSGRR
jgi:hypothetical protein